jgi:hypothetical protein
MKTAVLSLLFAPLLVIELSSAAKIFTLDFSRSTGASPLRRRADEGQSYTDALHNEGAGGYYTVNATVGTPPQNLMFGVDTGSSDVWVTSSNNSFCTNVTAQQEKHQGCSGGVFDTSKSSTYAFVNSDFSITYQDGSGANGNYMTDVLSIGDISLTGQQMGLATNTTNPLGLIGLGFGKSKSAGFSYLIPANVSQILASHQALMATFILALLTSLSISLSSTRKHTRSISTVSNHPLAPLSSAELTPRNSSAISQHSISFQIPQMVSHPVLK